MTTYSTARCAAIDDVAVQVCRLHLDDDVQVVRLCLDQLAIEGKSYVDLSAADAIWLAYSLLRAAEALVPSRGREA